MHFTSLVILALGLATPNVIAHPGAPVSLSELQRRGKLSKRCEAAAASMNQKRHTKRSLEANRALQARSGNVTVEITTEVPYYEVLQNDTCVLTPEVTTGPYYYPKSQVLKQDMTGAQAGVELILDVGVLDMATCEPLAGVLVDFWHCNATGSYSSFTGLSPNEPLADILAGMNLSVSEFEIGTTDIHTDELTWLRGMWPTDSNGMMEMKTIFPGFYIQRAIHIHTQVHTDWVLHSNGTLSTGNTVSTGQLFANESLSQTIMALSPYSEHTQIGRTTNSNDTIYDKANAGGFDAVIDFVAKDGVDVANGMIGYVTLGVDTTALETKFELCCSPDSKK